MNRQKPGRLRHGYSNGDVLRIGCCVLLVLVCGFACLLLIPALHTVGVFMVGSVLLCLTTHIVGHFSDLLDTFR